MTTSTSKLSVIGAGSVGTALAYAAMIRGSAKIVALQDVNESKVEAEVLDLAHGTQFMQSSSIIGGASQDVTADSDVVVITAGAKQKPGQTRLDLAAKNVSILESMLPGLVERSPNAVFMLVTNPVDVLTYVATKIAGLPDGRVFGSGTVLDSSRLRWLLGKRLGVSARSVHSMIIGEHGDSEFAMWSTATVGQLPLREACTQDGNCFSAEQLDQIEHDVINAAYKVIEGKGATNYAIGVSGARIVEAVLGDQKAVLPVSSIHHGIEGASDVAISVPSIVGRGGVERALPLLLDEREQARLDSSVTALRDTIKLVGYAE
ncbi:L-lactate dehydrogenase [Trueperella pecoris]|uniref:L-lactate dehydrogenase n=1 Tax=Trueperella pecoris TaxID=2733571 RepID=A0A7M1QVK5_9ACTO|nr:L-lactate dehydrogenase [Trueperella pecoris]QOQ39472.1 L-lactate dehydrogenase [Trueperella pecoris]QOR45906.1 L-lactate dehydrogenase [Trueperella pecoris]QTG75734.1 L-lactate dehydrogenase [Trueperella pecoris]